MATNLEYLRRVPLFKHVQDQRLEALADFAVRVQCEPGELILREGEQGHSLFVLLGGLVRIEKNSERGERVMLAYRRAGDVIGELSLIDEVPRSAFAVAHTRVRMLRLGRSEFRRSIMQDPELSFSLMQSLSERLRESSKMLVDHRTKTVQDRVQDYLIQCADESGRIELPGSQSELASLLGCAREALNRALNHIIKTGLIEKVSATEYRLRDM